MSIKNYNKYKNAIPNMFELVASSNLSICADIGLPELNYLNLSGEDSNLTRMYVSDVIAILEVMKKESDCAIICTRNAELVATTMGLPYSIVDGNTVLGLIESETQKDTQGIYNSKIQEPKAEEVEKFLKEEIEEEVEEVVEEEKQKPTNISDIENYYASYYNGLINELIKRYTEIFSSGYELKRPSGVLTSEGIVKVSGTSKVVHECSVSTTKIYNIFSNSINFEEKTVRSERNIADELYNNFSQGNRSILYFPNKMLEFAFGISAPTGDKQESLNTYPKHVKSNSWKGYLTGELRKSVTRLINGTVTGYVLKMQELHDIEDYRSSTIEESLESFLGYVKDCLSFCILFPQYKVNTINGMKQVSAFKIRVCDPTGWILNPNTASRVLSDIIQVGFMGDAGAVPFSYMPEVSQEAHVVNLSHEFNHDIAQSTPLFAYKALETLLEDGKPLSWKNLILGQDSKDSIIKSSEDSLISLLKHLTHWINAGSRGGKGVMTLNFLAACIASRKAPFYLDDKPDMASLLKFICPDMFVVNGGDVQPTYDVYNQWSNLDALLDNVPEEVLSAFGVNPAWAELGDIIYMRALKLVIGIIMLRGSIGATEELGGKEGIMLVVDEFSNFQRRYMNLISSLTSKVPPVTIDKARDAVATGKMTQAVFDRVYNNANYYALSYLNSAMKDLEYLQGKKDAGFIPEEVAMSDVFVIGQSLEKGMFNVSEFRDTFKNNSSSSRYKTIDSVGLVRGGFDIGNQSIPFNVVNFKTADAFFGRNMEDGRDVYLAQTNKASKAYGKLDDKASNFAYMSSFTDSVRSKIVEGNVAVNLSLAENCKYFKPFLILNSSGLEDECVRTMFDRVQTNTGITPEELTRENPSYTNPNRINESIGFLDYITQAGVENVQEVLSKSSNIANYVVRDLLGYNGTWLDFLCDLSPNWLFTVEDIVQAGIGGKCSLKDPTTNPILEEYYNFNPERFSGSYVDPVTVSESDSMFYSTNDAEDYSDEEILAQDELDRQSAIFKPYTMDDDMDIFEDYSDSAFDVQPNMDFTSNEDLKRMTQYSSDLEEAEALLQRLKELGINAQIQNHNAPTYTAQAEPTMFNDDNFNECSYINTVDTFEHLMGMVTTDVLNKFGGLDRIYKFGVIGGSLCINDCFYRCKVNPLCCNTVPYDIRRELNSGNVSNLFYFGYLYQMHNLVSIVVDSKEQFINYVAQQLGITTVKELFDLIPSLQTATIGSETCSREYLAKIEQDLLEAKREQSIIASVQKYCFKGTGATWAFAKTSWQNNNSLFTKALGFSVGSVGAVATGTAGVGIKLGRYVTNKAIGLKKGISNLFN